MVNRKNGGFTLVELLVTIAIGSVITLAATTVLLLGLRLNHQSTNTVTRQNTTRILLSVLEDMASEGTITEVKSEPDSWIVLGKNDGGSETTLFSYYSASSTIYTGDSSGAPLLEGVRSSYVELNSNLLTFSVETEDGTYTSSVYCRMAVDSETTDNTGDTVTEKLKDENPEDAITDEVGNKDARAAFLKVLASQRGSKGVILDDGTTFYSQWYIGEDQWNKNGWNVSTPWCACFISWALAQDDVAKYLSPVPKFANVDKFMAYFDNTHWKENDPHPGDLIFFDWSGGNDPEHVGAVLTVSGDYVYTIEGNSAGIVAVRKYALTDDRIIGYGVLDWNEIAE